MIDKSVLAAEEVADDNVIVGEQDGSKEDQAEFTMLDELLQKWTQSKSAEDLVRQRSLTQERE